MADGHLEPLVQILRVGGAYGEPFTWAAVVRHQAPDEVQIDAALRAPTVTEWRQIRSVLEDAGIQRVSFLRRTGGAERRIILRRGPDGRLARDMTAIDP